MVGEDPAKLDAILVTHEHVDHVSGLAVLARKLGIPVFFTEPTHRAWVRMLTPRTTMTYAKWLDHMAAAKLEQLRFKDVTDTWVVVAGIAVTLLVCAVLGHLANQALRRVTGYSEAN